MLVLSEVSLMAAFLAGLLSFISPCVLPLVPGYISFISGISLEDIENKKQQNKNTMLNYIGEGWYKIISFEEYLKKI